MFKSITYDKYLGYDEAIKMYSYEYTIVDDDFVAAGSASALSRQATLTAVIDCYSERNLNVPHNLFLYIKYYSEQWGYSIPQIIEWNRKYCSDFSKYEDDLQKYLILV